MGIRAALAMLSLAMAFALTACVSNPLSTAASMRVEVEVYKGPLSKSIPVQWGELEGLVEEAEELLGTYADSMRISGYECKLCMQSSANEEACGPAALEQHILKNICDDIKDIVKELGNVQKCIESVDPQALNHRERHGMAGSVDCDGRQRESAPVEKIVAQIGDITAKVKAHANDIAKELENVQKRIEGVAPQALNQYKAHGAAEGSDCRCSHGECVSIEEITAQIGNIAARLKAQAFYWAETHTATAPQNRELRTSMAAFANLASELASQMETRADALQWQFMNRGEAIQAKHLPLSIYLRNAEPTDFLNLYTWNRAAAPALVEDMILHPDHAFSSGETADRVRVIERLFADYNWAKINTVYGSGEGDFSMALVKDELGNWNLKSFKSDPSDLLQSYVDLALLPVKGLAKAPASGLPVNLPDPVSGPTQGQAGSNAGQFVMSNKDLFREKASEKLKALLKEHSKSDQGKPEVKSHASNGVVPGSPENAEERSQDEAKKKAEQQKAQVSTRIRTILRNHLEVISTLQESRTRQTGQAAN